MEKYRLDYIDTVGVNHKINIYDDNYSGPAITVTGYAELSGVSVSNILDCIRGKGLRVYLDADETLTYEDLYSEDERTQKVEYYRNGALKFFGWLDPEGWYEDFVTDKWQIAFDCVDGLGYLTDLAFVDDEGLPFVGKKTMLEIIRLALHRTGFDKDFFINIDVYYSGADQNVDALVQTVVSTERYVKDDGDTIMSCREVILDILEPFGAIVTDVDGVWCIIRPNNLVVAANRVLGGMRYSADLTISSSGIQSFGVNLGSQVRGYYPHHDNSDQRIRKEVSLGAYRVNYKYGLKKSLTVNENLCNTDGVFSGWDIINNYALNWENNSCGIGFSPQATTPALSIQSDPVVVLPEQEFSLAFSWNYGIEDEASKIYFTYKLITREISTGDLWYYSNNAKIWSTSPGYSIKFTKESDIETPTLRHFTEVPPIPDGILEGDAEMFVQVYLPETDNADSAEYLDLVAVNLIATKEGVTAVEGENHTFTKTTKPFASVEDVKEVLTGDNVEDIYVGMIYKADGITPTQEWREGGTSIIITPYPLLRQMGYFKMRMNSKVKTIFEGSVFGYIDYLTVIEIDGFDDKRFMPIEYRYNTLENSLNIVLKEILNTGSSSTITYEYTLDYGNVVRPTIKS